MSSTLQDAERPVRATGREPGPGSQPSAAEAQLLGESGSRLESST
jgi:hypothetical protein